MTSVCLPHDACHQDRARTCAGPTDFQDCLELLSHASTHKSNVFDSKFKGDFLHFPQIQDRLPAEGRESLQGSPDFPDGGTVREEDRAEKQNSRLVVDYSAGGRIIVSVSERVLKNTAGFHPKREQ